MGHRRTLSHLAGFAALGALTALMAGASSGHTPSIARQIDCAGIQTLAPDVVTLPPRPTPTATSIAHRNPVGLPIGNQPPDALPFIERVRTMRGFAGIWWDSGESTYNVAARADDLEALVEQIWPHLPRATTVYFHPVAYSYAELDRVTSRILSDRDAWLCEGIAINEFAVMEPRNVIELGIHPYTPEAMKAISDRYAVPIEFEDNPGVARLNN